MLGFYDVTTTIIWSVKILRMKDYQKEVDDFLQQYDEPYWPPLSILARITEEVGEVARLLNHMYGSKPKKSTNRNKI